MQKDTNKLREYLKYTNMGIQMLVVILGGVYGGIWMDEKFQSKTPVYTIIFSLIGVFAAIYLALKDFIKKE